MGFIAASAPVASGGGGGGDLPTGDTLTLTSGETIANFARLAGALKFRVKNVGPGGAGNAATATVNGAALFPGDELIFTATLDPVTNVFKYLPAFTVVTNGAELWWNEER